MFTSSGLKKLNHLKRELTDLMSEQFLADKNEQGSSTHALYQKISGLLENLINENPKEISQKQIYFARNVIPFFQLIRSSLKLTDEELEKMDDKEKKLIRLLNQHLTMLNPMADLVQNFSKKKSFSLLIAEKNIEATLYYEFCKQLGNYTKWYTTGLLLERIKVIATELRGKPIFKSLVEQLDDLMIGLELISYRPTFFSDQTQVATLVTAAETCFNEIVRSQPSYSERFTELRKQLHDLSREFEGQEIRRHERSESQKIKQHADTLKRANEVLTDCLFRGDFSSIAVIEPNTRNRLLEIAAFIGNSQLVEKIIKVNPTLEIDYPNGEDRCALELAILEGHKEVAIRLKEKGAKIDRQDRDRMTILQKSIIAGNKAAVKLSLQLGADINFSFQYKYAPFELAIKYHHFEIAAYLCSEGAEINRVENGAPFLHRLIQEQNDSGIDCLLKLARENQRRSELLEATDEFNCTAWEEVLKDPTYSMIYLFQQHGVKLDVVNEDGSSLLHYAAGKADVNLIWILSALNYNFNVVDNAGNSALHTAFLYVKEQQELIEVTSALLDAGLDGAMENADGLTALNILEQRDSLSLPDLETMSQIKNCLAMTKARESNIARADSLKKWLGWSPFFNPNFVPDANRKVFFKSSKEFKKATSDGIETDRSEQGSSLKKKN